MASNPRRPKAVDISDKSVSVVAETRAGPEPQRDEGTELPPVAEPKGGFSWLSAIIAVAGALVSLALGLWFDGLVRELLERSPVLGWIALGLGGLLVLLVLGFIWRELAAISRQKKVDRLRAEAASAIETDDRMRGLAVLSGLDSFYHARPDTARGRATLQGLRHDIIDGAALMALAEAHLMDPLDSRGVKLVSDAAKRVSVVTAISPRAIIDISYVAFEAVRLIRSISDLYGGRPGFVGFVRLARSVIAHLAVTGGVAMSDALLHEVLGTSIASRISARLGEGVLNGFLTARIGLAALDLCRPLPFSDERRPTISQVTASVWSGTDKESSQPADTDTQATKKTD